MPDLKPVLDDAAIYGTNDRYVCLRCAGVQATHTGVTTGGFRLELVTGEDLVWWAGAGLGALSCECGRLTARLVLDGTVQFTGS